MADLRQLVLAELPDEYDDEDDLPMVTFVVVDPAGPDAVLRMQPFGGADLDGWTCSIGVPGVGPMRNYDIDAKNIAVELRHDEDGAAAIDGSEDRDVHRLRTIARHALSRWDADRAAAST